MKFTEICPAIFGVKTNFMKNSFLSLIFILLLSAVIFITGCQSFMADISKLVEPSSANTTTKVKVPFHLQQKFTSPTLNIQT